MELEVLFVECNEVVKSSVEEEDDDTGGAEEEEEARRKFAITPADLAVSVLAFSYA